MTLLTGISKSALNGLFTGLLLATTTLLWLNSTNSFLLPVLVASWWLVIFGGNLLHAYNLSNYKFSNGKRFGLQLMHAVVTAGIYWVVDILASPENAQPENVAQTAQAVLQAEILSSVHQLLSNTEIVVPAAFVLSLITSGLLFSILTRPSAK